LTYLNHYKSSNAQIARWHDSLQEFDYEIKYRPGTKMAHADALSRAPVGEEKVDLDALLAERYDVCMLMTERERVLMCQAVDPEIAQQIKVVSVLPGAADEQYEVVNGLLYKKYKGRSLFVMP